MSGEFAALHAFDLCARRKCGRLKFDRPAGGSAALVLVVRFYFRGLLFGWRESCANFISTPSLSRKPTRLTSSTDAARQLCGSLILTRALSHVRTVSRSRYSPVAPSSLAYTLTDRPTDRLTGRRIAFRGIQILALRDLWVLLNYYYQCVPALRLIHLMAPTNATGLF